MNVEAIRHLYQYHFSQNRALWDNYVVQLSDEQFEQDSDYSFGSVRQQLVHMMIDDNGWFCDLREMPDEHLSPEPFTDRQSIRQQWDIVEQKMQTYLASISDEILWSKPLKGEDEEVFVWQVLMHVVNHGTDHRAQVLRLIHDLGIKTTAQDYIFYVYDNLA